jgi:vacuolar-type H+-ATPase subunit H
MARRKRVDRKGAPSSDESSAPTLQMIRERESEIDRNLQAVKEQVESVVSEARHRAAEIVSHAEVTGDERVHNREREEIAAAQAEADLILEQGNSEVKALHDRVQLRTAVAVDAVVSAVLGSGN